MNKGGSYRINEDGTVDQLAGLPNEDLTPAAPKAGDSQPEPEGDVLPGDDN